MSNLAKITVGLLLAAGAAAAIVYVGQKPSGPTLEQAAEAERAVQQDQNREICRLARQRSGAAGAGAEEEREQDKEVVRVKCEPSGL